MQRRFQLRLTKQASHKTRYIRIGQTDEVWAQTLKNASTSLMVVLAGKTCQYTQLKPGDHVRMIVRDPRDRLVSAWSWFTKHHNSYISEIMDVNPTDNDYILNKESPFKEWVLTALRYWNPHWAPQTEVHPRWREFELIPIHQLPDGWGHEKQTRPDTSWQQYYDDELLALVNEVYKEDIVMWKEVEDGIDTRANRVL